MVRSLLTLCFAAMIPVISGCAMCCGIDDYAYPTYGGKWERADREHGRVGSAFYDPAMAAGQVIETIEPEVITETTDNSVYYSADRRQLPDNDKR